MMCLGQNYNQNTTGRQKGYLRALECNGEANRSVINTGCSTAGTSIPNVMNAQSNACSYSAVNSPSQ